MNGKFLFDTNAIIYYLQGLPEWVALIDGTAMTERYASVVTRMELLAFPGITEAEAERIRRFLADLIVMPLDDVIENTAIEVRRTARLKLPDAIVVATAVSGNPDYRRPKVGRLHMDGLPLDNAGVTAAAKSIFLRDFLRDQIEPYPSGNGQQKTTHL